MQYWFKLESYQILSFVLNEAGELRDHVNKKKAYTHAIYEINSRWDIHLNVIDKT